ncbi:MAG: RNA polymerase sigma factor [Candidatus Binatia bacterium]
MTWPGSIAEGRLSEMAQARQRELVRSYRESGEVLVASTRPRLVRLAKKLGLDLSSAKDTVQHAFQALFHKRPKIDDVEGWLVKVVSWRSRDWLRDRRARGEHVCLTTIPEKPVAELSPEQRLAVQAVLDRLPKGYRRLVQARYFEGHTEEEAAELAGLSPASYKKTMTRALTMMREELERGCKEKPAGRRRR